MTDAEIQKMTDLLVAGRPVKEIAYRLGYSADAVYRQISVMRKARQVPHRTRQMWLARIATGRSDIRTAAKILGVRQKDVRQWMREEEENAQ